MFDRQYEVTPASDEGLAGAFRSTQALAMKLPSILFDAPPAAEPVMIVWEGDPVTDEDGYPVNVVREVYRLDPRVPVREWPGLAHLAGHQYARAYGHPTLEKTFSAVSLVTLFDRFYDEELEKIAHDFRAQQEANGVVLPPGARISGGRFMATMPDDASNCGLLCVTVSLDDSGNDAVDIHSINLGILLTRSGEYLSAIAMADALAETLVEVADVPPVHREMLSEFFVGCVCPGADAEPQVSSEDQGDDA